MTETQCRRHTRSWLACAPCSQPTHWTRSCWVAWPISHGSPMAQSATSTQPRRSGQSSLVITADGQYVLTNNIEATRLAAEEPLKGLGFELVVDPWYGPNKAADALLAGKRLGSDGGHPGSVDLTGEIAALRTPRTPMELARFQQLGKACAKAMDTADPAGAARADRNGDRRAAGRSRLCTRRAAHREPDRYRRADLPFPPPPANREEAAALRDARAVRPPARPCRLDHAAWSISAPCPRNSSASSRPVPSSMRPSSRRPDPAPASATCSPRRRRLTPRPVLPTSGSCITRADRPRTSRASSSRRQAPRTWCQKERCTPGTQASRG